MAEIQLKSLKLPGLADTYVIPDVNAAVAATGWGADNLPIIQDLDDYTNIKNGVYYYHNNKQEFAMEGVFMQMYYSNYAYGTQVFFELTNDSTFGYVSNIYTRQIMWGGAHTWYKAGYDKTSIKLVWTNASTSSTFADQTIACNLADADLVLIEYKCLKGSSVFWTSQARMGAQFTLSGNVNISAANNYTRLCYRTGTVSTTGVTFSGGGYKQTDSTSVVTSNDYCIPTRIYAIKGVL